MHVGIVSYSKASTEFLSKHDLDDANIQDLIAFCARVSNPSNQMNTETSEKLIKYLIKRSLVSVLICAAGFDTFAQNATSSCKSVNPSASNSGVALL